MNIPATFDCPWLTSQLSHLSDSTVIGFSAMQREIRAWRQGCSRLRPMLIVAGQHGDETCAMLAAARLIRHYGEAAGGKHPAVWIIPCLNPDGTIEGRRLNGQGVDLNRDHLARLSPEVRSLHAFIRRIEPRCVLDLHCFPARRRWMKKLNIEHAADLLVDWATGPAALLVNEPDPVKFSCIRDSLREDTPERFLLARYWLRSGRGRIRHSTPDWLDLRNQVAACYRIPTYLIEGREPLPDELGQTDRTIDAMVRAVTGILDEHHRISGSPDERPGSSGEAVTERMATRFHYRSRQTIETHLRDRTHQQAYVKAIGRKHSDCIVPRRCVRIAQRFWIPKSLSGVIGHLERLNAPLHDGADQLHEMDRSSFGLLQFRIADRRTSRNSRRNDRSIRTTQSGLRLSDPQRFVVLIPSVGDRVYWTALLDPRHKFSICRLHRQELCRSGDDRYPILFEYRHR